MGGCSSSSMQPALSSLSPLRGSRLIFHPVYCQLPGGGVHMPFFTLSARIFVVRRPCRVPRTSQHSKLCVSHCMSLLTRACYHGELFRGSRNNKHRMSDVNTRPVTRSPKFSATRPTEIMLSVLFPVQAMAADLLKTLLYVVFCWIFNQ